MPQEYAVDDLGVQAKGDIWSGFRHAVHPQTGAELALCSLSRNGFVLIDAARRWSVQVAPPMDIGSGWAVAQAPDGSIYQANVGGPKVLLHWNWQGTQSKAVAELTTNSFFTIDVAPDGRVYLPEYTKNILFRYDPATGRVEQAGDMGPFGQHIQRVCCAPDGWVYVTSNRYDPQRGTPTTVVAYDPATNRCHVVGEESKDANASPWQYGALAKDAAGRVLLPSKRWGRMIWHELVAGRPRPIDPALVRITPNNHPFAFADGGYISEIVDKQVTYVDAAGSSSQFTIEREDAPLRIFSVQQGGGRIWGGTFIPLTLFSYDPAANKTTFYGSPSPSTGEIYNMAFSCGKLFMASYTGATLTRYSPDKPWRKDQSLQANPAQLGKMKEQGLDLQRPYGQAMDPDGTVYFAARGDYGCVDSGICRIDPQTDEVTRWIYPNTTFAAICYVKSAGMLLVSERRSGEAALRFTLVNPASGEIAWSEPVIQDGGDIVSWLDGGGDIVYGMHAHRATLFEFSIGRKEIGAKLIEMQMGWHCHNALVFGPDGRIWGLTNKCIWAAARDLSTAEKIADYPDHAGGNGYRFGICQGPDGAIYFPNGTHLMRLRTVKSGS